MNKNTELIENLLKETLDIDPATLDENTQFDIRWFITTNHR